MTPRATITGDERQKSSPVVVAVVVNRHGQEHAGEG